MRDLGFEVIQEGQQQKLPAMQSLRPVKEEPLQCFLHNCNLGKRASQTGWQYVTCPHSDCVMFTALENAHKYVQNINSHMPAWYSFNKDKLKCFCKEPLQLCESRSEKNPLRVYLRCQRNQCKFFQWADEVPKGKNIAWMNDQEQLSNLTPVPTKEYSGRNPLWDHVNTHTRFKLVDGTNKIMLPREVKGFRYAPEYENDLLQIVYFNRLLKLRQQADISPVPVMCDCMSDHPREVEIHRQAVASGFTG